MKYSIKRPSKLMLYDFVCFGRKPTQAATWENDVHALSAGHLGDIVPADTLPWHLHEGGGGTQDKPAWVTSSGRLQDVNTHLNQIFSSSGSFSYLILFSDAAISNFINVGSSAVYWINFKKTSYQHYLAIAIFTLLTYNNIFLGLISCGLRRYFNRFYLLFNNGFQ